MSHSFVNPAIYVLRNRKFRDGFAYCFSCLPCVHYSGDLHNLSIRRGNTCRRFTSSDVEVLQNVVLNDNSVYFYEPSTTKLQHRTSGILARVISNNNFYSSDHHHRLQSPTTGSCSKNGGSKKCGRNSALISAMGKKYSRVPSNGRNFESRMSSFAANPSRSGGMNNGKLKTAFSHREGHTDSYA
uniref:Uncharacterized protein n=1 Tax=Romanomermis culicivorax TaxID=13658 RepID=A0A915JU44_ROMCU